MIYLDFEYQSDELKQPGQALPYKENTDPERVILATVSYDGGDTTAFDLRDSEQVEYFKKFYLETLNEVYVSFNCSAEVNCLLSLGLPVRDRDWIDLFVEGKMVMLTSSKYFSSAMGLVDACRRFGVPMATSSVLKDIMRNIILENRSYTSEQWKKIVAYGLEDTSCLPQLQKAISGSVFEHYKMAGEQFDLKTYLQECKARGAYCRDSAIMFRQSLGLPVDKERMEFVYGNLPTVKRELAAEMNELLPDLFIIKETKKGTQITQSSAALQSHIDDIVSIHNLQGRWPVTATGLYKTDDESLKSLLKPTDPRLYSELMFYKSLKSTDFRLLVNDKGYIAPVNYPFSQKTGRSSPKPTQGYILAADKWIRCFVKPKPGMVLLGADWSSQEIFIAAAVSQDKALMDAYLSGDVYLSLAKMAGDVPEDGTRENYEFERQMFKAVQLGLAYGKGVRSLAQDLYLAGHLAGKSITANDAQMKAKAIVQWHRETFKAYWKYIDAIAKIPKSSKPYGIYKTVNNDWTYFIDRASKSTALQNAPMQSNGASVMRVAAVKCFEAGLDVACTQHDALYVNSTAVDSTKNSEILRKCMQDAVAEVFGHLTDENTRIDIEVYSDSNPYYTHQPKGYALLQRLENMILKETVNDTRVV